MQPKSLFQKIWDRHVIRQEDSESLIYIDRCLIHEGSNHSFLSLAQHGRKVARPKQIFAFADHYVPTDPVRRAAGLDGIVSDEIRNMVMELDRNTAEAGIAKFGLGDEAQGIHHVAGPELGITQPGITLVGGDSHTSTHGAFGCLAFGIGASEVTHVMATQALWQRKPKLMRISINGPLGFGVTAKDVILAIIGKIGIGGAIGHVIEYAGSAIRSMSMEQRMTICNMSIEAGGRAGMVAPDDTTYAFVSGRRYAPEGAEWERAIAYWRTLSSDEGAVFDREVELDAAKIAPMVTWGTSPEQVLPIGDRVPDPAAASSGESRDEIGKALKYMDLQPGAPLTDIAVDRVFIGSCTNGRLEDLRAAAAVARLGRAVVPAWVVPGSSSVKRAAEAEGIDKVFRNAGFEWRESGCSMCTAINGDQLKPGERCASTSNRNFQGRQGPGGRTHLMSPAMAAAVALTGRLTDVRSLMAKN
jgi:3-isopropylmalate/(R)-2-methylmalate dehydratase large subunit